MTKRQSEQLKKAFLDSFRKWGNVSAACREAGIGSRNTVYKWQESDTVFAAAYSDAEIESTETLEREAFRRAHDGTKKPIYHNGAHVGDVQEYSDTLLIFLLKARRPDRYRENIKVDMEHRVEVKLVDSQAFEAL